MLSRIANSIRDYVSENTHVSYDRLVRRFGTPKEIVAGYINELEPEELLAEFQKKKNIYRTIVITSILCVMMWGVWIFLSYTDHANDMNGYVVVEIVEVEKTTEED